MNTSDLSDIEHVQKRPAMYVGSTGFFGLVHYLVGAVNLNLSGSPSYLSISKEDGQFTVESDADLLLEESDGAVIYPFEGFRRDADHTGLGYDGPVLNALSASLSVIAVSQNRRWSIQYRRGHRETLDVEEANSSAPSSRVSFVPDQDVFTITAFSPYNFHSYVKRLSYLNPGVRFTLNIEGNREEFHFANGIQDMFECISAPYQIMHDPIHFRATEDNLDIELIFAFHSWSDDVCWSFVNKGRAVEGGTHEKGLAAGLKSFRSKLDLGERDYELTNGVIGIMSLHYPDVVWEGCIKAKIGDPKLTKLVKNLVLSESLKWISEHPNVVSEIREIQTFQFPDVWPR